MPQPLAYLNGELVAADQAVLSVSDAGVVQGATVSETLRTFGHRLFQLDTHLERFANSLATVGFDIGLDSNLLAGICNDLVAHNTVQLDPSDDLGLVLFATAGSYATYSGHVADHSPPRPTLCAHTFPLAFEIWDTMQSDGLHLVTPSVRQLPADSIDPAIKHRSRLHYYLADREAATTAPGARAVLLDHKGRLTETAAASFLLVEDTTVLAPSAHTVLPGISIAMVQDLCQTVGLNFRHRDLRPEDVADASEALVASTPYCLGPVTRFNLEPVGSGQPGPVFDRLMTAWDQLVGLDVRSQIRQGAARRRSTQLQMTSDPETRS